LTPSSRRNTGRTPTTAAAYFRATGEVVRALALAGVRLEEPRAEEEKRAKATAFAEEARWSVEESERAHRE
jgi:hypothetical protein